MKQAFSSTDRYITNTTYPSPPTHAQMAGQHPITQTYFLNRGRHVTISLWSIDHTDKPIHCCSPPSLNTVYIYLFGFSSLLVLLMSCSPISHLHFSVLLHLLLLLLLYFSPFPPMPCSCHFFSVFIFVLLYCLCALMKATAMWLKCCSHKLKTTWLVQEEKNPKLWTSVTAWM